MRRAPASILVEIADITGAWLEEVLGAHAPGASVRVIEVADAHLGNMFVDGTTPGLLDWAVVGYAPGLRDVAYFLGGSVPIDLRREQERRLIACYCERLGANGVMLGIDAAWDQNRVQLVTAWIAAVVTAAMGSKWQPIEVGMGATLRADAAIEDHGVADLLSTQLPS